MAHGAPEGPTPFGGVEVNGGARRRGAATAGVRLLLVAAVDPGPGRRSP